MRACMRACVYMCSICLFNCFVYLSSPSVCLYIHPSVYLYICISVVSVCLSVGRSGTGDNTRPGAWHGRRRQKGRRTIAAVSAGASMLHIGTRTLQHTATHCNTLHLLAAITLQHTATYCNTLQVLRWFQQLHPWYMLALSHCSTLHLLAASRFATHCNSLQLLAAFQTAAHCNC